MSLRMWGHYIIQPTIPAEDPVMLGTMWYDQTSGTLKICTSVAPYTFTAAGLALTHSLLSTTHPDTTPAAVTRGALVTGQGASPTWARLTLGATGTVLHSDGTDVAWAALVASDLPATAVVAGAYGGSTAIPTFTVDAQGRLTAASTAVVIAPAGTLTGTTLAATVVTSSLTAVGTVVTGVWNAGAVTATALNGPLGTVTPAAISATTGTFSSTLGVTGAFTGTSGAFSTTLGVTGTSTLGVVNAGNLVSVTATNLAGKALSVRYNAANVPLAFLIDNSNGYGYLGINANAITSSASATYDIANSAARLKLYDGLTYSYAASGSAGAGITWSDLFSVSNAGLLAVSGFGIHSFSAGGTGANEFILRNTTNGSGNFARLDIGNDQSAARATIDMFASSWSTSGRQVADGTAFDANGAGGLSIASTNASGAIRFYSGGTTLRATLQTAGTWTWAAYGAGAITADASGNLTSVSDARFKNRIAPLPYGLPEVLQLRPVQYGYNALSKLDRVSLYGGFLADDDAVSGIAGVKKVMPLAIGQNPEGYLTFSDRPILGAVVNAIRTLDARLVAIGA